MYSFSEKSLQLQTRLSVFMDRHIYPNEELYAQQLCAANDRFAPLPLMDELKEYARDAGLWNLFVPESHSQYCDHGGLSNFDYAPLAEIMGRILWCSEVFNCNAPDTGNMEVFMNYATDDQREQWLKPLLAGDIRSSYAMTEPQVASSDATNIELAITREGDEWVLNGRKWFITGAMNERTKILIVMGKSDPTNSSRHLQQTQILVPKDTKGIQLLRSLTTLGYDDAPLGHAEITFNDVRVPLANVLLGEGRGFEIAQGRLGPGRMHHCMRYYHEQMDGPGRARRGMLADCFEAFVGALFLDKQPLGMAHAKAFTHTALFTLTPQTIEERRWMDPKARLQYCLAEFNSQEGLNSQKGALHKTFSLLDEWGSPSSALNLGPNNHYPDLALTLP